MHDIRAIRENPELYEKAWAAKGSSGVVAKILELDAELRRIQTSLQSSQADRNELSKKIGQAKAQKNDAEAARLMAEVERVKERIVRETAQEQAIGEELRAIVAALPNIPAPDVPVGADEHDNVEIRRWGEPFAIANPKDHVDLGEGLGLLDFEAAARMSGARFTVLKGQLARLERAIGQFMLDLQTQEHGYLEVAPPLLVRTEAMFGTGQLPKFADDQFRTDVSPESEVRAQFELIRSALTDSYRPHLMEAMRHIRAESPAADLEGFLSDVLQSLYDEALQRALSQLSSGTLPTRRWLIPTAEVSLTNLVREQITAEEELPLRLTALTHCFRAEAGASGRDTRGMIRQHQFQKVELVSITAPEDSETEHERMVECAEAVLKRLELPFRTMLLCTGDMGFSARKTYDLEVWLPSEGRYREISSCSNCGDFQARRMDARCKGKSTSHHGQGHHGSGHAGRATRFVHSLNGSGLAVGRTLVAIMENYQDEGGRIAIPQALHRYLPGLTHIGGDA